METPFRLRRPRETRTQLRAHLREITRECMDRGLNSAAKWSAELMNAVPKTQDGNTSVAESYVQEADRSGLSEYAFKPAAWDEDDEDRYQLALAFFRSHEHLRAVYTLRHATDNKSRWLKLYAKYLVGERRIQEDSGPLMSSKAKRQINPHAVEILEELADADVEQDSWLLYLKAIVLLSLPATGPTCDRAEQDYRRLAGDALIASVKLEPYNWSAWQKLAQCIEGLDELETVLDALPATYSTWMFFVYTSLELHSGSDSLHAVLDVLETVFPGCSILASKRALLFYHLRQFELSAERFEELQKKDPYRVDDLDTYSNILYVTERPRELAKLAQEYIKIDRARPEVCCVIGNHFSLRRDHEKAILYFRRALKLDRSFLSAWTLMGHEFIEIKNTNAAIESYRHAVDVNMKDYRAWYGLGQTYELLGEPYYAVTYYQRATVLRPYDARMWSALAVCYEKLKKVPDAIRSYQRALLSSEAGENDIAVRLSNLYASQGQHVAAKQYHKRALAEAIKAEQAPAQLSKMWIWLARWEMDRFREGLQEADLRGAQQYLEQALDVPEDKEEAQLLLKDVESLLLEAI